MKIIYEKHPVTPERKQQLRSQGYTIIDARFAPKDYVHDAAQDQPVTPERKQQLRSQGYTIINASFAPKDYAHPDANASGDASGNAAAVDATDAHDAPTLDADQGPVLDHQDDDNQAAGDNLENMTLDELKKVAKDLGVRIHANSGADKFIEAIRAAGNNGEAE